MRALIPPFALAVAAVAAITDPSSAADLPLAALAVGAFAAWAYVPNAPLWAVSVAVVAPVVVAQRSGGPYDGLWEFLLVAAPIPFTRAVGAPVNPIALK